MGLIKADFYRFFVIGFAAGAVLVLGTTGIGGMGKLADDMVPSAVAAPATR